MRVQKTGQNIFVLIIDVAIFTGVIIGVIVATSLIGINKAKNSSQDINKINIESLNTLVIGDYSDEEDKNIANIKLKEDLKKKYNIDVISAQPSEAAAQSVNATSLYDLESTYYQLNGLVDCLSKYPSLIFPEMENKNYDMSIYLVDHFENDNIALATRDSNNKFNIYISNTKILEKAIHHELYHILEYYMKLEFDINILYANWGKYNPLGFKYNEKVEELDNEYVYNSNTNEPGAYFVTIYAKSMDKEDRAETFADMMIKNVRPIYYDEGEVIGKKAEYISSVLEKSFKSIKESKQPLYWKRFM